MNVQQAIDLIDVNQVVDVRYESAVSEGEISTFTKFFNISYYDWSQEFANRMKQHWIYSWICTDTRVGYSVYCFDKIPVAISMQTARKDYEEIQFLSHELAMMVRDEILKIIGETEDLSVPLIDKETKIPDLFRERATSKVASYGFAIKGAE